MTAVVLFLILFLVVAFWKASWFLHPVITWHRLVLRHHQEVVPVGFADWDIHCSCGKKAEL